MAQIFTYIEKKKGLNKIVVNNFEGDIWHEVEDLNHAIKWIEESFKRTDRIEYGLEKLKERHGVV